MAHTPDRAPYAALSRRVLVTGAAGLIGSAVVRRLLLDPGVERVVALDVRPPTSLPSDRRIEAVAADLRQPPSGFLAGIDTVLHFAFRLRPSRRAAEDREVNVTATARLLAASAAAGVRCLVGTSSAAVYGARPGAAPHPETDPLAPAAGFRYGEHKAEVEELLARFAADHPAITVAILRPCTVLAPGATNFVTDLLGLPWLPVAAGADPDMQFLHVADLADAVVALLDRRAEGPFNLAGSGTLRWREVIALGGSRPLPVPSRLLAALADLAWKAHLQSRSPAGGLEMIRYPWLVDTGRARALLGWEPRHTSRRVLEEWARASGAAPRSRRRGPGTDGGP